MPAERFGSLADSVRRTRIGCRPCLPASVVISSSGISNIRRPVGTGPCLTFMITLPPETASAAEPRRNHGRSASWLMQRSRQRRAAKIERGALDDGSAVVEDQAKSPMFREKGQAMPAQIRIGAAFGEASDLAGLHLLAELRQCQAEAFGNHRCLNLNNAIADLNRFHGRYYILMPGLARLISAAAPDRRIRQASWRRARA